jgi:mannose-1-phosphate guanylyltransferase/phosphomannomutase
MKAIVLCGGKGTRLRPYTYSVPKPMLLLGKKPILEYVLSNLKENGINEVYLTVGYLAEQIENYFKDGSWLGMKIYYSKEDEEKGTAGSILPLKEKFKETFVVAMGDHLTDIRISEMIKVHKKNNFIATVALHKRFTPLEYGIAEISENEIIGFKEKPTFEHLINAGVYVFEPKIFDYIKEYQDFANDVFPNLLKNKIKIGHYIFSDYWLDIGRVADYERVNRYINIIELVYKLSK